MPGNELQPDGKWPTKVHIFNSDRHIVRRNLAPYFV